MGDAFGQVLGQGVQPLGAQQGDEVFVGKEFFEALHHQQQALVRVLGVSSLIDALETTQDGNYVFVRGALPEDELNAVLGRLSGAMELAGALDRRRPRHAPDAADADDAADSDEGP